MAEMGRKPVTTATPRKSWRDLLVRELAVFVVLLLTGVIATQSISYPNTEIVLGFDVLESAGQKEPAVLLDFDTPTVDQMHGFKTTEDFDRWAKSFVATRLASDEILKPGADLRVIRVPDLSKSQPKRLLKYTVPLSGLRKMFTQRLVRATFIKLFTMILLPYGLFLAARSILWVVRIMRTARPTRA